MYILYNNLQIMSCGFKLQDIFTDLPMLRPDFKKIKLNSNLEISDNQW